MTLAMTPQAALLTLWVTFTAIAVLGIAAALVWAVRSGQFSNQDHARRLPLESGVPNDGDLAEKKPIPNTEYRTPNIES